MCNTFVLQFSFYNLPLKLFSQLFCTNISIRVHVGMFIYATISTSSVTVRNYIFYSNLFTFIKVTLRFS